MTKHSTDDSRPTDPLVEAKEAGRVIEELCARHPELRREFKRRARAPPDPDAYSIPQFCLQHQISESFFYKLQALGLGPRVMRVGGRTLVSKEAAAEWRRRRETTA